ncbi:enoyl-CoA hydratase/carnithine racemase [Afipia massiliensis]|uniref:Enoyl-CoA hydratase/carnithine racemase n=1 Tax=Afipia massiliensis TaxID=211460 RepID=A0A840MY97_9BRAD|nr:enoyl-CoA hydratase/carnithine racemase [Afipia massiliensis]
MLHQPTTSTGRNTVSFAEIDYRVTDRVAIVTLSRPEQLNA